MQGSSDSGAAKIMKTGKKVAQKIRNANCKKVAQKIRNANWKKVAKGSVD